MKAIVPVATSETAAESETPRLSERAPAMVADVAGLSEALCANVGRVLVGKDDQVRLGVLCLLIGGHALIEDVPGVGKTTLAKSLAKSIGGDFERIQFTPDLLPSDVLGVNVFDPKSEIGRGHV